MIGMFTTPISAAMPASRAARCWFSDAAQIAISAR